MAFASLPSSLDTRLWVQVPVIVLHPPYTKVAISLPELVRQTNAFSVKRRAGCQPTLKRSRPKELYLEYNVVCHESYSDPRGHDVQVQFDLSQVEETQDAKRLDVRVSCSCPAFLYWGAQWNLHQRDGLHGQARPLLQAPTQRLDLRGNFVICVAPGTKVLMADGTEKPIEQVRVGDWAITHLGRPRKVTQVSQRPPFPGELGWSVEAKGRSNEPLVLSGEHPLAVVRETLDWVPPPSLRTHEYLYFPRIRWQGTKEVPLALASLLGYYLAEGSPIYRRAITDKKKSGRPRVKGIECEIKGKKSLVWGIKFVLNQDEAGTLAADIDRKLHSLLGSHVDVKVKPRSVKGKKWLDVLVNNGGFAAEMVRLGGFGSPTKRLSLEVFEWSHDAVQELVASYALGDGHLDSRGQQYVYSTSPYITSQVSTILYSMGIWNGRMHQDSAGKIKKKHRYYRLFWDYRQYPSLLNLMKGRLREHVLNQLNALPPGQKADTWENGFTRILYSAVDIEAPESFHNLSVDEDESYIANGIVVHNCKHVKAVFERILPAIQHNITKVVREREVKRTKERMLKEERPTEKEKRLHREQMEMRMKKDIDRILRTRDPDERERLIKELVEKEKKRLYKQVETERGERPRRKPPAVPRPSPPAAPGPPPEEKKKVVKRDEPATAPPKPPVPPRPPREEPGLEDLVKEEERKLRARKPPEKGGVRK